jgi:filamentous hemagglutinin family protein
MTSQVRVASQRKTKIKRQSLMISCAAAAIAAAAVAPQQARAQAFNGTPGGEGLNIATVGSATRSVGTNAETITVGSSTATIDWAASSNIFLPSAKTATFTSSSGLTNYTVLNRIAPVSSAPIELNGNVISTLQGTSAVGGNVWFYSPSGILVGPTAVFDVGGLLLSSNPVTSFSQSSNGFDASFGAGSAASSVTISSGAQINALRQNSYVALIAPSVTQAGTVKVDGSAAYVAAEQLTMTMDQGLFDITVPVGGGSSQFIGIDHSGSTTGGSTSALSGMHRVYVAAVPKNEAITMLLSGTMGFDATVAGYENGQIRLSSGWTPSRYTDESGTHENYHTFNTTSDSSILISGGTFLSPIDSIANAVVEASSYDGPLWFKGNISLWSLNDDVMIRAVEGDIRVDGNASLTTSGAFGSEVSLLAQFGSNIDINGHANLYAGIGAISPNSETVSTDNQAGNIFVEAFGGTIEANSISAYAFANGQDNAGGGDQTAGNGTGGDITFEANSGGSIKVLGSLYGTADGYGGHMLNGSVAGGSGQGGNIYMWGGSGTS